MQEELAAKQKAVQVGLPILLHRQHHHHHDHHHHRRHHHHHDHLSLIFRGWSQTRFDAIQCKAPLPSAKEKLMTLMRKLTLMTIKIYILWWSVCLYVCCHVFAYFVGKIILAGGKIILAGWKIILAGGKIILTVRNFFSRTGHHPTIQPMIMMIMQEILLMMTKTWYWQR